MKTWKVLIRLKALVLVGAVVFFAPALRADGDSVAFTLNSSGLSSLTYEGVNYLSLGDFRLNAIEFQPKSGVVEGDKTASCRVIRSSSRLTCLYQWGSITVNYSAARDRFQLAITVRNNTHNVITGLFLEPLSIRFPQKPDEYDGNTPILATNIGEPTVLKMTYGLRAVALVDEGVRPLMLGFPFAADRPQSMQVFPLRVNTSRDPMYPDSLPKIDRPIGPGRSDTYRISIRFGSAATTKYHFAPDVYTRFAARYPSKLNWPDRRPIASLILGTTATGWDSNPRGWLLDPKIDVTTDAGVQNLYNRIMKWADDSIAIMRQMNAQGMVTWDIEGEQYPQPTTYIGDPRVFANFAPEMSGIADDYFRKFRDTGFRVGVCIRPQQLAGEGEGLQQTTLTDPTNLLISKIEYAKQRWGASLFYVDSNGDPNNPMAPDVFARVAAAEPDVLLVPEHKTLGYYGSTAPYREMRGGWSSSPQIVREVYPKGLSVINIADGNIDANETRLRQAIEQGDIMMFRGWFNDPNNAKIATLYQSLPASSQSSGRR